MTINENKKIKIRLNKKKRKMIGDLNKKINGQFILASSDIYFGGE